MALAAAQVLDAIQSRLATVAASGGRVFQGRGWPLTTPELPAWRVVAGDEQASAEDLLGAMHRHQLEVRCEARCEATTDVDDTMHLLASQGLAALFAEPRSHALELTAILRGLANDGEAKLGVLTLVLRTEFWVTETDPDTIISD